MGRQLQLTQHKRFPCEIACDISWGHPNPSLMLRPSFMLKLLGGCDFVYMEIAKWNENFVGKIKKAKSSKELQKLWEVMKEKAHLSYKVDIAEFDKKAKDFPDLSLEDQKRFLLECLDKNHLYINYSEIDDKEYRVSEEDKKLSKEFYEKLYNK